MDSLMKGLLLWRKNKKQKPARVQQYPKVMLQTAVCVKNVAVVAAKRKNKHRSSVRQSFGGRFFCYLKFMGKAIKTLLNQFCFTGRLAR
jgi:hypothetical protein